MEQQRALNALEPYIALSKSATSPRAAADLITQATSSPQTYVFAELLQTNNVQALRQSPEYASHLTLLEIFAWGSYDDYNATPNLPKLNTSQHTKLQLLSLLPLCTSPETLTYSVLKSRLFPPLSGQTTEAPPDHELETLITTAIYAGLLTAHLDPLHRTVRVTSVAPLRDLAPNSVPALVSTLTAWDARCTTTLSEIEAMVTEIKQKARYERIQKYGREQLFESAVGKEGGRGVDGGGANGGGGGKIGKNGGGFVGKVTGFLGENKGGKRAAPSTAEGNVLGGLVNPMEIDDDDGGAARITRGVKRQGRGTRG